MADLEKKTNSVFILVYQSVKYSEIIVKTDLVETEQLITAIPWDSVTVRVSLHSEWTLVINNCFSYIVCDVNVYSTTLHVHVVHFAFDCYSLLSNVYLFKLNKNFCCITLCFLHYQILCPNVTTSYDFSNDFHRPFVMRVRSFSKKKIATTFSRIFLGLVHTCQSCGISHCYIP